MSTTTQAADVLLTDGSIASIRPVIADDHDQLLALHDQVSDESTRLRFFALNRDSGHDYTEHLYAPDAAVVALVAVLEHEVVGLATAEIDGDSAEIAANRRSPAVQLRPRIIE